MRNILHIKQVIAPDDRSPKKIIVEISYELFTYDGSGRSSNVTYKYSVFKRGMH
jgi:hypothetical protein